MNVPVWPQLFPGALEARARFSNRELLHVCLLFAAGCDRMKLGDVDMFPKR
jgi:hypothetical protein